MQHKNNTQKIDSKHVLKEDFTINPLNPYTYEFEGRNGTTSRIDYFYLDGNFNYDEIFYKELKKSVDKIQEDVNMDYKLYSIYIYRKTEELNKAYNKPREFFDGKNKDIVAYIRFTDSINDIFYIINDGHVVYDNVERKSLNFEFDE